MNDKLKEALVKYGWHVSPCRAQHGDSCTCGFDEALGLVFGNRSQQKLEAATGLIEAARTLWGLLGPWVANEIDIDLRVEFIQAERDFEKKLNTYDKLWEENDA